MALSGVLITIFTIYSMLSKIDHIDQELYVIELENAESLIKAEHYLGKIKKLNNIIENSIEDKNGVFHFSKNKMIIRYSEKEIKLLIKDSEDNKLKVLLAKARSDAAFKKISSLNSQVKTNFKWSMLSYTVGFFMSCFGFYLWYLRVQRPLDRLNENEQ
jgi:hypothetical protein